ncbi:MAG: EAL domain-containing response regulator [Pseudomonadota bacterium]
MIPSSAIIIDDDPIFQMVAAESLRALGVADIVVADNGMEGLHKVANASPSFDLIICDLQMPELDGAGVVRELSQIEYKGALIIASSEKSDIIRTVHAMAKMSGIRIQGTINKPISQDKLKALLTTRAVETAPAVPPVTRHMLKTALIKGYARPYYQPKMSLRRNRLAGVEVLTRVHDPNRRSTSPEPYLLAAEREDLTLAFTLAILDQVIADIEPLRKAGIEVPFALNLSPSTLSNLDLPDIIAARCKARDIDPTLVTLEITENRLLAYEMDVLEVLSRFRLLGFRLSMDDFGTGATSIEQLRLYPFNELKIDQSFIQTASDDPFAMTTVETSARLAAMLGLDVVAEGIETDVQMKLALEAGAHIAQGYLISHPMRADDLADWILSRKNGDLTSVA